MAVKLNHTFGEQPFEESARAEVEKALSQGVVTIFHPSGTVWQVEGGTIQGANIRLVAMGRTSVTDLMDKLKISDEAAVEIAA